MFRLHPAALFLFSAGMASAAPPATVRFATYNVSFFRDTAGKLAAQMADPEAETQNPNDIGNIRQVAEALQRIQPDVLLLNEFDYDGAGDGMRLFQENFLAVAQQPELAPLVYPYRYSAPSNTGVSSGFDLDNNGAAVTAPGTEAYGNDCFGFGVFPGQYGLAVFSKFPIDPAKVRSFQHFKWKDMPGAQLLLNSGSPPLTTFYTAAEREVLRLSSKTHLDIPVDLGGGITAHLLASHPTPPKFDGGEDRTGQRTYDEIRFWADYIDPDRAGYIYDDQGLTGGLAEGARFVIEGDQNSDPNDGDKVGGVAAAGQLTRHRLVNAAFTPSSAGAAAFPGGAGQTGNKGQDTAAFRGGLRVDYVLPSKAGFSIFTGGVFWPGPSDPLRTVVADLDPSDHHMVWVDLRPRISLPEAVRDFDAVWSGNGVALTWQGSAGYVYAVQGAASMTEGSWLGAGVVPVIDPDTLEARAVVPVSSAGRMFYRLEVSFAP